MRGRRGDRTLTIGAVGVVFGDIGTSPLYAVALLFSWRSSAPSFADVVGGISLVLWTLGLIVAFKYSLLVLKADNDGEGGVFALYGLLDRVASGGRARLLWPLLLGAGLLFGDGVITPAISVLSAVEGLSIAAPPLLDLVVPVTVAMLAALFWFQHRGTHAVGYVFGPVMTTWFVVIGVIGLWQVSLHPAILASLSPVPAVQLIWHADLATLMKFLGAVILVVTGGEALYADMGHFGPAPIRRAWFTIAFPALILNYLGQGAYLLGAPRSAGPGLLFHLVPHVLLPAFVGLATLATVIASQALISGTFSLVSQAIALGFFPRMHVRHTHHRQIGEVYVPFVNWLLFGGCVGLVIGFRSSAALGSAYGLAVSGNMLATSVAMMVVAHRVWRWPLAFAVALFAPFTAVDAGFLFANSLKMGQGGYVPVAIGLFLFAIMLTWHWGRNRTLLAYLEQRTMPIGDVLIMHRRARHFVEQTAVLMIPAFNCATRTRRAPALLQLLLERNGSLPRNAIFVHVEQVRVPYIHDERVGLTILEENANGRLIRVEMRFGFMEEPDVEEGLRQLARSMQIGLDTDHRKWTVHVVREHLVLARGVGLLRRVRFKAYQFLRLVSQPTYYHFGLGYDVPLSVEILPVRMS